MADLKAIQRALKQLQVKPPELKEPLVPIAEWIKDPYYVGKQGVFDWNTLTGLYPYYQDLIKDIFEYEGKYDITVLSGGIGVGKTTLGLYCFVRKLYEQSVYRNPQGRYGLMPSSPIVFLYFCAVSKFMAIRLGKQLRGIIDQIPYFQDKFPRDLNIDSELRFPNNISVMFGTGEGDMIGNNVLSTIIDEANFKGDATGDDGSLSEMQKMHSAVLTRQASRFTNDGVNYGLNIVISSATTSNSYTEKLFRDAATNPRIKAVNFRTWDVKPWKHKKERFYVFCGNEKYDPFVMDSHEKIESQLNIKTDHTKSLRDTVMELPQDLRRLVDAVPVDLQEHYYRDIFKSLRDFSGVSVYAQGKLFQDKHVFDLCIDRSLVQLFSRNEFVIETNNDSPTNRIQYYLEREFQDPDKPRFLHIDLGLTNDAAGIACCYKSGETIADGVRTPVYTFDFSLRIVPPPLPRKISIARINEFVMYLTRKVQIGMLSMDNFQSQSSLQFFEENKVPCRYQSVDRTDKAYLFFVECMYRQIVKFPLDFAEAIKHELFDLDWNRDKHKVDHPSGGTAAGHTKDRMDAVVGALYNAYEIQTPTYNPQDVLSLSMHNPMTNITYREDYISGGCMLSSQSSNQNANGMANVGEAVISGYDEDKILQMPLSPKHTAEDEHEDIYGSSIDWESVMERDDDY